MTAVATPALAPASLHHGSLASRFLFGGGCLVNIIAYGTFQPLFIAVVMYASGALLLRATPLGGDCERKAFRAMFAVGWMMAGVAAIYANFLDDPFQNFADAANFFELATRGAAAGSLEELRVVTEGAGAVVLWQLVYDAFGALGFAKDRYIGVLVNVMSVSMAAVIGVKIARVVYGDDTERLGRLVVLMSWCGLFWLFAAIHLRDGVVLLGVTSLAYVWVRYLDDPTLRSLSLLVGATILAFGFFVLLRTDFLFVPLAMLFAGLAAVLLFQKARGARRVLNYAIAMIGVAITASLYLQLQDGLVSMLTGGYEGYLGHAAARASRSSLGMALVVNQPIPIRLILGSAYLYVYPIPFWSGLELGSAYHLFKSLNALFFVAVIPLSALAVAHIVRDKRARTPALMFLLFLVIGFTLAVAGTSLETRHLGAFFIPLFVVGLLPDFALPATKNAYGKLLAGFLSLMGVMYLAWFFLKL